MSPASRTKLPDAWRCLSGEPGSGGEGAASAQKCGDGHGAGCRAPVGGGPAVQGHPGHPRALATTACQPSPTWGLKGQSLFDAQFCGSAVRCRLSWTYLGPQTAAR